MYQSTSTSECLFFSFFLGLFAYQLHHYSSTSPLRISLTSFESSDSFHFVSKLQAIFCCFLDAVDALRLSLHYEKY